jgi:hypothetical protein
VSRRVIHASAHLWPETPTSLIDAELMAQLCRKSWRNPIDWDTVEIRRRSIPHTDFGFDVDILTATAWVNGTSA